MRRWNLLLITLTAAVLALFAFVVLRTPDRNANSYGDDSASPGSSGTGSSSGPSKSSEAPSSTSTPDKPGGPNFKITKLAPGEKPPQFIIFSFDGGGNVEKWKSFSATAKSVNAQFTAFLTGTYLLPDAAKQNYTGPGHAPGKSSVGFGGTAEEVAALVEALNTAHEAGHEIGTHYNGHFCAGAEPSGKDWDTAQWNSELDQFFNFLANYQAIGSVPGPPLEITATDIRGGRTPCLEGDPNQSFPAMLSHGMQYDSSMVSNGMIWPSIVNGVWELWMPTARIPALGRTAIAMDYNFWYVFNKATEAPAQGPQFTQMVLDTYRSMYTAAFAASRPPLVIGNHFNNWSGNAFNPAVDQFMAETCANPETICTTYQNVLAWMAAQDPAVLQSLISAPPVTN